MTVSVAPCVMHGWCLMLSSQRYSSVSIIQVHNVREHPWWQLFQLCSDGILWEQTLADCRETLADAKLTFGR